MESESASTISRRSAGRILAFGACVFAFLSILAPGALGAGSPLVKVKVAPGQTVDNLLYQRFVQSVTCNKECDVTTIVSISRSEAEKLGYKAAASTAPVTIASSYIRVKANKPTSVGFVLSAEGHKLLPKAKSGLNVVGKLTVFATGNPKVPTSTGWNTNLK